MSAQVEQWRVSTVEGVFETDLETLKQWIAEGTILPTDKVSKGKLNWIDAGRAPMLKAAFNGESVTAVVPGPALPPPAESTWEPEPPPQHVEAFDDRHAAHPVTAIATAAAPTNSCYNHPGTLPLYICPGCATELCEQCTKFVDVNRIPTCPLCGEFCKLYEEFLTRAASIEFQNSGFGFKDFALAIRYPFQHKFALLCGALVYGLLLLAGFRGSMIAFVIMFGCMSHVISQVAWGHLNRSFMPDFSEFSLWDDLVVPIFLGIGITIVTWGPVIVLVLALFFGVMNSGPTVSPLSPGQAETAESSTGPNQEDLAVLTDPDADPKKLEEANKKLNELRPANQINREAERAREEQDPTALASKLLPYLGAGILLLVLFLVGIAWAIFYYPMALTVAGYTQSFGSVLNPLVGLDTIRRMGSTYFKAFGMVLVIQVVGLIVSVIVAIITSPFALPWVGNLPATFIGGTFTFYFNLVIACLLGLSLFKCGERLGINVD